MALRGLILIAAVALSIGALTLAYGALSTAPTGQKTWYWQNPLPQGNALYGVDAVAGTSEVWAVGGPGVVLHSNDDGAQWDAQDPNTGVVLRAVDFVDDQTGWVAGDRIGGTGEGVIRNTVDGGSTWTTQTSGVNQNLTGVSMATAQTGWVVGWAGAIRKTVSGGATWTAAASNTTQRLYGISAVDTSTAWAVGAAGTITATKDGSTWVTQTVPASQTINAVSFVDTMTGYAVGAARTTPIRSTVLKTTDGGATWALLDVKYLNNLSVPTTLTTTMQSVSFRDASTGWIAGVGGLVLFTQDGGATWTSQKSGAQTMNGVVAASGAKAHLVGANGVMLRTVSDGQTWIGQQQGTTARLNGATWTGASSGIVVGAGGLVMKTEDSGDSWVSRTLGANDLYGVKLVGSDGWIVGSGGFMRKTSDAGESWVPQSSGTTQTLNAVTAYDSQIAWAVGGGGKILKTTNGGASWVSKTSGTAQILYDVHFIDASTGWAAAAGGYVLKTINGGDTWTITRPITSAIYSVYFTDANSGWFTSTTGRLYRTSNGGTSWVAQTTNTTLALYSIEMADSGVGWAVGGAATGSVVLYTANGGTTWTAQDAGFRGILRAVTVRSASTAGLVGDAGAMRRTFDGGATWDSTGFWSISNYRDLSFATVDEGWAVGQGGAVAHTHDGGRTWGAQQSGATGYLYGVDFTSEDRGWAVGQGGVIRATTSHTTWTGQTSGVTSDLRGVDFLDLQTGWVVGDAGVVLKTNDGGSNWTVQPSGLPTTTALHGVSAVDTQTAFAWGGAGTVIKTADGGATWSASSISPSILYGGSFTDSQTGWVAGAAGVLFKTTDGGSTWGPQAANAGASVLRAVSAVDSQTVYLVGDAGVVRKTLNGGASWATQLPGTVLPLYSVAFSDADHGWLVGDGGAILRTTDSMPPETTLQIVPPSNGAGWYMHPQITLISSEPGLTYYSWSSSSGPWTTFSVPIVPPADGTHTLYYYSIDPAANKEPVKQFTGNFDATPPSTPSTPAAAVQSATEVVLTWDASFDLSSGTDYYEVRDYGSLIGTSPVNSMTLSSLATETVYSFSVVAVDVAGNASDESGPVAVSTLAGTPRPPQAIFAADGGAHGPVLNWEESTGTVPPVSYRVWRSVAGAPFSAIATISPGAGRSYVDAAAPRLTELRYVISTRDARGEGPISALSTTTALTPRILPAPTGVTARNTASVTLTWTPSPLADSYHVYRATASTSTATTLTLTPVTSPTYHDATTGPYAEYWYSVATVDASGNVGAPSPRVFIRTEPESTTVESPHGAYSEDTAMCAACHRAHSADANALLLVATTDSDAPLCLSCHDGTSASDVMNDYADTSRVSRHPVSVEGAAGSLSCSACHLAHAGGRPETVKGMLRIGTTTGNSFCYQCHGTASDPPRGDLTVFEDSAHGAGVVEPPTGTKVVCLSCHVGHSAREDALYPYSGDDRCLGCHSSSGLTGTGPDIASSLSGDGPGTRHDLLSEDGSMTGARLACANCHEPHTSTSATPCVDPDSPTTTHTLSASGVTLCLRCHDDALPSSADTSGWVEAPLGEGGTTTTKNIKDVWDTNVHGDGDSDSPELSAELNFAPDDDLTCANCHDAHGSTNRYALKESVAGTGTANTADNLAVVPVSGGGWDLRFYCDSCHDLAGADHSVSVDASISAGWVDCTRSGCHTHADGGL